MIEIADEKYYILKNCTICGSDNHTKLINFKNDITGNGNIICLCKKCREQLIEKLKED